MTQLRRVIATTQHRSRLVEMLEIDVENAFVSQRRLIPDDCLRVIAYLRINIWSTDEKDIDVCTIHIERSDVVDECEIAINPQCFVRRRMKVIWPQIDEDSVGDIVGEIPLILSGICCSLNVRVVRRQRIIQNASTRLRHGLNIGTKVSRSECTVR